MKKIIVNEEKQERIDKYLSEKTEMSRSLIAKMIDSDLIKVNDNLVSKNYKVSLNDVIIIIGEYKEEIDLIPKKMDLDIIYEDDYLMIINKPSGLTVHPGSGNFDNTLVNGLLYYNKTLSDIDEVRPGIVHRLDKDTSGLMMVAKDNKTHELLADDFKNKRIKREYIAIIDGVFPHQNATIDAPIGRDIKNRKKMSVTDINSKKAITHFEVIERYSQNTLIKLKLETGRTHQIRVHMEYIGYPISNDPLYNHKKNDNSFGQMLHSFNITFLHPITKKELTFSCSPPKEFDNFLESIKN